ncbi:MAG: divalent-cation tolerance protein CutA [Chloroflexi bacterium]|nr:divalent-cation tolerance protein CutA [Chloroflexota bacterium]
MAGEVVVLITASSAQEGNQIARSLLEKRKVACVNIVPSVSSLFWWQDKIDSAEEVMLVAKSREDLLPQVIEIVKQIHSYEVPEIIALPIVGGNADYLQWLNEETNKRAD